MINSHDLCYQCSKYGPGFLFGKLGIRDSRDEPHFPAKIKLLSSQIKMNTLFQNNNENKRRRCNKNIHHAVNIPVGIYEKNNISLLQLNKTMHENFNLKIIYGYRFLINLSLKF